MTTDCHSEEGITVGLIDSLISIARVLAPRLREKEQLENGKHPPSPIQAALLDLEDDKDVRYVLGFLGTVRQRWLVDNLPRPPELPEDILRLIDRGKDGRPA